MRDGNAGARELDRQYRGLNSPRLQLSATSVRDTEASAGLARSGAQARDSPGPPRTAGREWAAALSLLPNPHRRIGHMSSPLLFQGRRTTTDSRGLLPCDSERYRAEAPFLALEARGTTPRILRACRDQDSIESGRSHRSRECFPAGPSEW